MYTVLTRRLTAMCLTGLTINKCTKSKKKLYEYTINVMWINKNLNENQKYIYPGSLAIVQKEFLNPIFKWYQLNSDTIIYVWYDSQLTSEDAVNNTQILIDRNFSQNQHFNINLSFNESELNKLKYNIQLKDIRELETVKEHPRIFSEETPIYFRVDLLKVVTAIENILKDNKIFIHADLDVTPMSYDQIFDDETINKLQKHGLDSERNKAKIQLFSFVSTILTWSPKVPRK